MPMAKLLVADIASSGAKHVPPKYIRPVCDRPNISDVKSSEGSIPLIDLQELHGPLHSHIIQQIGLACQEYGFFQVKNHGVPETTTNKTMSIAKEFFKLPESDRLTYYSSDPAKATRLATSFNVKTETVSNWRDYLRLHCYPVEDHVLDWPSHPPSFRKEVGEYCTSIRGLILRLLECISESLGLEKDYIDKALGKHQHHMSMNYYPPCPQPELTFGLAAHTDPTVITVLLQDDVPGLQILKDGKWVAVDPIPNTFIVNVGDQMQVISNDRYKSGLHRAVVNRDRERLSIPTFYFPSENAIIEPAKQFINDDCPAVYNSYIFRDYFAEFWNRGLAKNCCLDLVKCSAPN